MDPQLLTLVVAVVSHRTDGSLAECSRALASAFGFDAWRSVLVRQLSPLDQAQSDAESKVLQWDVRVNVGSDGLDVEELIDRNRELAYLVAFESMKADACLVVEDDVLLGYDALSFSRWALGKYGGHWAFRGVNLGSAEPREGRSLAGFSLLRFGLHGQAALIPKKTWNRLRSRGLLDWRLDGHWDSRIEDYMKSGFVVTPNLSRYLDLGVPGTHMNPEANAAYLEGLRASWVGAEPYAIPNYRRDDIRHHWRRDATKYRLWQAPRYSPRLLHHFRSIRARW